MRRARRHYKYSITRGAGPRGQGRDGTDRATTRQGQKQTRGWVYVCVCVWSCIARLLSQPKAVEHDAEVAAGLDQGAWAGRTMDGISGRQGRERVEGSYSGSAGSGRAAAGDTGFQAPGGCRGILNGVSGRPETRQTGNLSAAFAPSAGWVWYELRMAGFPRGARAGIGLERSVLCVVGRGSRVRKMSHWRRLEMQMRVDTPVTSGQSRQLSGVTAMPSNVYTYIEERPKRRLWWREPRERR